MRAPFARYSSHFRRMDEGKRFGNDLQKTRTLCRGAAEHMNACVTAIPCVSIGFAVIQLNSGIPTAETKGGFHPNITVMFFFFFHMQCMSHLCPLSSQLPFADDSCSFFPPAEKTSTAVVLPFIFSRRSLPQPIFSVAYFAGLQVTLGGSSCERIKCQ